MKCIIPQPRAAALKTVTCKLQPDPQTMVCPPIRLLRPIILPKPLAGENSQNNKKWCLQKALKDAF